MSKIIFIFGIALAILFSGCGDKKEASKENFQKVINSYYNKNDEKAVCFNIPRITSIDYLGIYGDHYGKFPDKVYKIDEEIYLKSYNSLTEVGLLSKKEAKVQKSKKDKTLIDGFEYNLTNLGTKFYKNKSFCVGKYKVIEITQFTPPTNFGPITGSQVSFKKVAVDIPNWALELAKKESYKNFKNFVTNSEVKDSITLILTNDSWITYMEYEKNMKK